MNTSNDLDVITRAKLADDLFYFAQNIQFGWKIVLKLLNNSKKMEWEYLPWKVILQNVENIFDNAYDLQSFGSFKVKIIDICW